MKKKVYRTTSLLVLVAGACSPRASDPTAVERTTHALITAGTVYTLKLPLMTGDTGNCVDTEHASTADGAKIQEWDCNGTGAQSFTAEDMGGGYYRLKNTHSGKCLNIYGGPIDADHAQSGNQNGTKIQQYTCTSGDNNYWQFVASNGYYAIKSKLHSGDGAIRCMDVRGGSGATTNGTQIELWSCNGGGNQTYNAVAANSGGGGTATACTFTNWTSGTQYNPGDIVYYAGSTEHYYICVNANPGYDPTISTWYWDPYTCGPGQDIAPTAGIAGVVSSAQFDAWFPTSGTCNGHSCRDPFYTYSGLTSTAAAYATFANSTDDTIRKREAAAFLANISWESDCLAAINEYNTAAYCDYCDPNAFGCNGNVSCACPAGSCSYYGRGPIQVTWPVNYKAAGTAIGSDLFNSPNLVATNADIAWKTGTWYWMTGRGPGGYGNNAHDAMMASSGSGGFGATIAHINGALECPSLGGTNTSARDARIARYKAFCDALGVTYGNNLGC
jgi:chitinase